MWRTSSRASCQTRSDSKAGEAMCRSVATRNELTLEQEEIETQDLEASARAQGKPLANESKAGKPATGRQANEALAGQKGDCPQGSLLHRLLTLPAGLTLDPTLA